MKRDFVLACLGNWGKKYEKTRHNFGFILGEFIAKKLSEKFKDIDFGVFFKTKISGQQLYVFKGKTFMNLSGEPIRRFIDFFNLKNANLIIAYDDITIPFGKIKIAQNGGAGGHKGVQSVIEHLGKDNIRIKLGIGKKRKEQNLAEFVLEEFSQEELEKLDKILDFAFSAIMTMISEGIEKAMSLYNHKSVI